VVGVLCKISSLGLPALWEFFYFKIRISLLFAVIIYNLVIKEYDTSNEMYQVVRYYEILNELNSGAFAELVYE
jgi:hypothetical protein